MKKIISLILALLMIESLAFTSFAEEKKLSRASSWTITASSSFPTGDISAAFDGNDASYWHSDYNHNGKEFVWIAECPHAIHIDFGGITKVSGFRYLPRQDGNDTGLFNEFKVFGSKDGTEYTEIYEGKFTWDGTDRKAKSVSWGDMDLRAIQIEILSTNGGFATAAAIDLLTGGTGSPINKGAKMLVEPPYIAPEESNGEIIERGDEAWEIEASSNDKNNGIGGAFDGKESTFWHTAYQTNDENTEIVSHDEPPHTITVKFPEVKEISGFIVVPRSGSDAGKFKKFEIYSSMNGDDFEKIYEGSFTIVGGDWSERTASWGNTKMKAIRIVITESLGGYGTAAEIKFLKDSKPSKRAFDFSDWKISVRNQNMENCSAAWGPIGRIVDGNPDAYWHSYYEAEGANITKMEKAPFWIDMVLPEKDTIEGFEYTPRNDSWQGRLVEYNINVSDSDDGELTTIYTGHESRDSGAKRTINFGIAVEVKRIQIEIVQSAGDYAAISDFIFTPGQKGTEVVALDKFSDEMYNTFLNEIDKSNYVVEADIENFGTKWKLTNIFDGATSSAWQSETATRPVTIKVDLGGKHIIRAINISPMLSTGYIGYWDQFDILTSSDGKNYKELIKDYSFPKRDLSEKTITLDEPVQTRFIAFRVKKYTNNRVSCGEISFMQTMADKEKEAGRDEKYTLVIDSPVIKVEKEEKSYDKEIDAAPYITSVGSTLIPLRGLLEEMGATVDWNDENQTITIKTSMMSITMQVGTKLVDIEKAGQTIRYTMTAPPKIKNGRTYIPVRFVSEHLGYNVGWDGETKTITIN